MDGLQGLAMEGSSTKKEKRVLKIVLYLLFSFCFLVDFACFVGFIVVYYHFFCMLIERIYFVEQAQTHPALTLSSDSDSPPEDNPLREGSGKNLYASTGSQYSRNFYFFPTIGPSIVTDD